MVRIFKLRFKLIRWAGVVIPVLYVWYMVYVACVHLQLAKKYHPDRNKGDAGASNKFTEIGEAYEVHYTLVLQRYNNALTEQFLGILGYPGV